MPNLTLIVGGPGSGKTSEVVSRLAARYEADPFAETVVLVPTVRHGDQLRRRLVARCGAALRLRVETIPQFSRQITEGARAPSRMLAGELLTRTARQEVKQGPAAYFRPIAGTAGFSDLLNAAVDDLLAEAIDPRELSRIGRADGLPSSDGAVCHLRSLRRGARTAGLAASRSRLRSQRPTLCAAERRRHRS